MLYVNSCQETFHECRNVRDVAGGWASHGLAGRDRDEGGGPRAPPRPPPCADGEQRSRRGPGGPRRHVRGRTVHDGACRIPGGRSRDRRPAQDLARAFLTAPVARREGERWRNGGLRWTMTSSEVSRSTAPRVRATLAGGSASPRAR